MKSLIVSGLDELNANTGKHSVSSKLSLVALIALGLTLFFLATSGSNLIKSEVHAEQDGGNKNNCSDAKHYECGDIANPLPATILDYVSVVDHGFTHSQQQNNRQEKAKGSIDWVEIEAFRLARENLKSQKLVSDSTVSLTTYTRLTFWAAAISLLISAFGMYFIWKTLSAANRANTIARESLEISNRAYLDIGEDLRIVENDDLFRIFVPVKNYGATPAINVKYGFISGLISDDADKSQGIMDITYTVHEGYNSMSNISGGGTSPSIVVAFGTDKGDHEFFVNLVVKYDSVFGDAYTVTGYWETIVIRADDHTSLNSRTPPDQIECKMQDFIDKHNQSIP